MKKSEVQIDHIYRAKVSGVVVPVQILRVSPIKGWIGVNLNTNREVWIKSAARLRSEVKV